MKTITLIISSDGKTKVETHGFDGQACQAASKFIETALGRKTAEQLKPEFFANINNHEQMEVNQ